MSDTKQKDKNDLAKAEAFTYFKAKNGSDNYSTKWSRCPSRDNVKLSEERIRWLYGHVKKQRRSNKQWHLVVFCDKGHRRGKIISIPKQGSESLSGQRTGRTLWENTSFGQWISLRQSFRSGTVCRALSFKHILLDKRLSEHQTNKIWKWLWNAIMLRLNEFGGQFIES